MTSELHTRRLLGIMMASTKPCQSKVKIEQWDCQFRLLTSSPESGNMLIMTLSYTQKTGDQSLIKQYVSYPILECTSSFSWWSPPAHTDGSSWSMDSIFDHWFPYSRESNKYGRFCGRARQPDQFGNQGDSWNRSYGRNRVPPGRYCYQCELQCAKPRFRIRSNGLVLTRCVLIVDR